MRLLESRTRNTAPVHLRIGVTGHRGTHISSADGPSALGDPDPDAGLDAVDHAAHVLDALPEDVVGVGDGGVLVVRVAVSADPVAGCDDLVVGGVDPGGPGVDVADLDAAGANGGLGDHASDVVDLAG